MSRRRLGSVAIILVWGVVEVTSADTLNVPAQYATIQAAINAARAGDTVLVADGTYTGAANRGLDFRGKPITLRSASGNAATCIIDCERGGRAMFFRDGETSQTIVEGITVRNGSTRPEVDSGLSNGGGIYCLGTYPTFRSCTIERNTASEGGYDYYGGGIYCDALASPLFIDCAITRNHGELGGGIYSNSSSPTFINCTISGNSGDYGGGGLFSYAVSSPTFIRCTMDDNGSGTGEGGGVESEGLSSLTMTDCDITGNSAMLAGGILHDSFGSLTLTRCRIIGNSVDEVAGGVICGDNTTVVDCVIAGNSSDEATGGISCGGGRFVNCLIAGNTAQHEGGGISCGNAFFINCTIVHNVAGDAFGGGGGLDVGGSRPVLTNCIVRANWPDQISGATPAELVITYSSIEGAWAGVGNIDADPGFIDSDGADNDPATWEDNDYRLGAGSPCIDAGDNEAAIWSDLDLDSRLRFVDDPATLDTGAGDPPIIDLGAYEYQGAGPLGDMNCDGGVDGFDAGPFVLALTDPAAYRARYPGCSAARGDVNGDASLNGRDIPAFLVAVLP